MEPVIAVRVLMFFGTYFFFFINYYYHQFFCYRTMTADVLCNCQKYQYLYMCDVLQPFFILKLYLTCLSTEINSYQGRSTQTGKLHISHKIYISLLLLSNKYIIYEAKIYLYENWIQTNKKDKEKRKINRRSKET